MRTTLDIDDDVLRASREIAKRERKTAGKVISELARAALAAPKGRAPADRGGEFFGFRPLPRRGTLVTNEIVDGLREQDAY